MGGTGVSCPIGVAQVEERVSPQRLIWRLCGGTGIRRALPSPTPSAARTRTGGCAFHSLPGSKRYPESEDEYAIVLDRYNTILDELFAGTDVFVVTMA
ncbi:hypothetical protein ABT121_09705 [Streptomyces sp. NPDC001928]|uniref:DUF3885 domain-containing protein n=1 Tax=Streptomyces sp. NPDC001928 TaxID=3154404 RepID=UPI003326544F